jgi:hypothetical protein
MFLQADCPCEGLFRFSIIRGTTAVGATLPVNIMPLNATGFERGARLRPFVQIASAGIVALSFVGWSVFAKEAAKPVPVKIAVFDFELDDESPAASLMHEATSSAAALHKVSSEARLELAQSGRYSVIDASQTDMGAVPNKSFRDCGGCEAGIALKLGAEQALIGVVKRATQTDYYVWIQVRDTRTGKILDQQAANFAGGEDGWASGVRMLIRHQLLASQN